MKAEKSTGPLEVVTVKGSAVAIYSTPTNKGGITYPGHTLIFTAAGKRQRRFVSNLDNARTAARETARQLSEGTGHVHCLSPGDVADYTAAMKILRVVPGISLASVCQQYIEATSALGNHGTLSEAARHYRIDRESVKLPTMLVKQVADEMVESLTTRGASSAYISQLGKLLPRITNAFRCPISTVTTADLQSFIDKINLSLRSKENYRGTVATLWNFAKRRAYLPRDKSTEADHLDSIKHRDGAIGIYSPEQLQSAILAAKGKAQLTLAIAAWAGLRTAEIQRLDWSDIGKEFITIQAEKAKTGARRIVPILPPLAAVLRLHKRGEGSISPFQHAEHVSRLMSDCFRAVQVEPVKNGLRHSFCTFRLATTQNAPQVALEAGNSPKMLFQHYRELATPAQGKAWFAVRSAVATTTKPSKSKATKTKKIIPFLAAA